MTAVPSQWRYADIARDVVLVEGDDARWFLHSQLSQDLNTLALGQSAWSFILSPEGRVDALVRVVCRSEALFTLDVERGFGEKVVARLSRFVLRARVRLSLSDWVVRRYVTVGASRPPDVAGLAACDWGGGPLVDVVAPVHELPEGGIGEQPEVIDAIRVDRCWPALGVDVLPGDVPAGTGILDCAVSFTKGCYPGQELVERMDSRGAGAPVQLRSVARGTVADGVEVTSLGTTRALARVRRGVDIGDVLAPPVLLS